jgi:cardiolipin synthase
MPAAPNGRRARLLVNPEGVLAELLPAIDRSRDSVDLVLFSLLPDGGGARVVDALKRASQRGVDVNVVIDQVGSAQIPGTKWTAMVRDLRAAGVKVVVTGPFTMRGSRSGKTIDHRKLIVIDGSTAFVGGMNFADLYTNWRDAMVELRGAEAHQAARIFHQQWERLGGPLGHNRHGRRRNTGAVTSARDGAGLLFNDPDSKRFDLTTTYLRRISEARERVWVTSPFVGNRQIVDALVAAAKRGADVRLLVSGVSPLKMPIYPWITRSFYQRLQAAGVKIGEWPDVLHAKTLLTDDHAIVSSLNLSRRAAWHDHEMGYATTEPTLVSDVERFFADSARGAREIRMGHAANTVQSIVNVVVGALDLEY